MESLIKADIFFFITTIALIVISAVLIIVLIYILKIVRDIFHMVKGFKEESDQILKDIGSVRQSLRDEGELLKSHWKNFLDFISFKKKGSTKKSRAKKENDK